MNIKFEENDVFDDDDLGKLSPRNLVNKADLGSASEA